MKKKPERGVILDLNAGIKDEWAYVRHKERVTGRNQAIEEYEDFLPSESELMHIIEENYSIKEGDYGYHKSQERIAKAISDRIRGVGDEGA